MTEKSTPQVIEVDEDASVAKSTTKPVEVVAGGTAKLKVGVAGGFKIKLPPPKAVVQMPITLADYEEISPFLRVPELALWLSKTRHPVGSRSSLLGLTQKQQACTEVVNSCTVAFNCADGSLSPRDVRNSYRGVQVGACRGAFNGDDNFQFKHEDPSAIAYRLRRQPVMSAFYHDCKYAGALISNLYFRVFSLTDKHNSVGRTEALRQVIPLHERRGLHVVELISSAGLMLERCSGFLPSAAKDERGWLCGSVEA
ncbi:hypothetical protein R3P38DRAFT_2805322 [Favolaschia claudopus]|uniref:Uncharacterized protein n=1 Tax=Favolaschia claudopus TaxID=2862362 RepID=A0AAV9ZMZ6_9AGAR